MKDFLDRLVTRAIGREAMLAPRLPSLFEPLQRAPIMQPAEPDEVPARRRDTAAEVPERSMVAPAPSPSSRVAQPAESHAAVAPDERLPVPKPVAAMSRGMRPARPVTVAPLCPPAAEPSRPSAPAHPATDLSAPAMQPHQPRPAPDRHESLRASPVGSLVSAPTPVFATPRAMSTPARPHQASAMRVRAAPRGSGNAATSEPVVHVSIGRLEVRAAGPLTGVPPARRDGPRPGSLDDYLRQRGGKASP